MIYSNIKHDIINCQACPLYEKLDYGCTPQWGAGNKLASILVLNFKSNQESHLLEKPLETKYSLLLRKLIADAGLKETDIFVTNLLKCQSSTMPAKEFKENVTVCRKQWLYKELSALTNLKCIFVFGSNTLKLLLDNNKINLDDCININFNVNGMDIYATHSFEELYRKGLHYYNHALETLKQIKGRYVEIKTAR